jgi:hypothetical protein
MDPAMKCVKAATTAIPLLVGLGLLLAACVASGDRATPVLTYGRPYGSIDLVGWR